MPLSDDKTQAGNGGDFFVCVSIWSTGLAKKLIGLLQNNALETTGGQEVKFHEIEIGGQMIFWSWDQIILALFMRSRFLIMIPSPDCGIFHEIKIP